MIKTVYAALVSSTALFNAFDNKAGWKLDDDGKIELKDGNPIYIDSNGKEMTVDQSTIGRLNGEARSHRERAETAETALRAFEGLDAAKAREALDTVGKLDQKKLIDAGEVDKVKDQIKAEFMAQIADRDKKLSDTQTKLDNLTLSNAFQASEFVNSRVAIPRDMFQSHFARHCEVTEGKIKVKGYDGNPIMSSKRLAEEADFDEAIEVLVTNHKDRDAILRAPDQSGTGSSGGAGGRGGGRVMRAADFDKLGPVQQQEAAFKAAKGEIQIVD